MIAKNFTVGVLGIAVCVSCAATAQDTKNSTLAAKIMDEVGISSSLSTPDELDTATNPYVRCKILQSGTQLNGESGIGEDCSKLRTEAALNSDVRLSQIGVSDEAERKRIVEILLATIDLQSDFLVKLRAIEKLKSNAEN